MTNVLYDGLFAPHRGSDRNFLILPGGQSITYARFLALSSHIANALRQAEVTPGDRVVVQVDKSPESLALYVACVQAGAIFLPLNPAYTPAEVEYFIGDAEPRLVVCDPSAQDALTLLATSHRAGLMTLDGGGSGSLANAARRTRDVFSPVPRSTEDTAAILYTSGTTGRAKGAMLTHGNLLSNARVLADYWHFAREDILLHALPIFHTHGLFTATNVTVAAGGAMIFLPRFDVDAVIDRLPAATAMMGVPTFYTRLLDSDRFTRERVAHMRLFVSGSAPLLEETHEAFTARTGHRVLERYGMTETNMNTSNPYDGDRRAGTVGFPLPGTALRIADPDSGEKLPRGDIGVIEVKGPNVCSGYWRNPEKTAAEFRKDGFFITGDLGRIDERGYVTIVGRAKDLIISGGYNVYPKEIERVIDAIPGVTESAVIGVPHRDFGEAALGIIVRADPALDEQAVMATVTSSLARFKHPKRLYFADELPRNAMGKVQKAALRNKYRDTFK